MSRKEKPSTIRKPKLDTINKKTNEILGSGYIHKSSRRTLFSNQAENNYHSFNRTEYYEGFSPSMTGINHNFHYGVVPNNLFNILHERSVKMREPVIHREILNKRIMNPIQFVMNIANEFSDKFKCQVISKFIQKDVYSEHMVIPEKDIIISFGLSREVIGVGVYYIGDTNKNIVDKMEEFLSKANFAYFSVKASPDFYMIVNNGGHNNIQKIGSCKIPIEFKNYSKKLQEDFHMIRKDLCSESPVGRILIFQGEPGTGKTYFIRGLINAINNDALIVILPIGSIGILNSSSLIADLIEFKGDNDINKPIVFILEDGDVAVTERKFDNSTLVSSVLNLSEGIIGETLDIKFIITANTEQNEFDEAITRPGRLLKIIHFELLTQEEAEEAYQVLVKDSNKKLPYRKEGYKLCDIFHYFKTDNVIDSNNKRPVVGF